MQINSANQLNQLSGVAFHPQGFEGGQSCRLILLWRGTMRYQVKALKRSQENEQISIRLRELANQRRRWEYRRLHVLLKREGWQMNVKRVYRICVEE